MSKATIEVERMNRVRRALAKDEAEHGLSFLIVRHGKQPIRLDPLRVVGLRELVEDVRRGYLDGAQG